MGFPRRTGLHEYPPYPSRSSSIENRHSGSDYEDVFNNGFDRGYEAGHRNGREEMTEIYHRTRYDEGFGDELEDDFRGRGRTRSRGNERYGDRAPRSSISRNSRLGPYEDQHGEFRASTAANARNIGQNSGNRSPTRSTLERRGRQNRRDRYRGAAYRIHRGGSYSRQPFGRDRNRSRSPSRFYRPNRHSSYRSRSRVSFDRNSSRRIRDGDRSSYRGGRHGSNPWRGHEGRSVFSPSNLRSPPFHNRFRFRAHPLPRDRQEVRGELGPNGNSFDFSRYVGIRNTSPFRFGPPRSTSTQRGGVGEVEASAALVAPAAGTTAMSDPDEPATGLRGGWMPQNVADIGRTIGQGISAGLQMLRRDRSGLGSVILGGSEVESPLVQSGSSPENPITIDDDEPISEHYLEDEDLYHEYHEYHNLYNDSDNGDGDDVDDNDVPNHNNPNQLAYDILGIDFNRYNFVGNGLRHGSINHVSAHIDIPNQIDLEESDSEDSEDSDLLDQDSLVSEDYDLDYDEADYGPPLSGSFIMRRQGLNDPIKPWFGPERSFELHQGVPIPIMIRRATAADTADKQCCKSL